MIEYNFRPVLYMIALKIFEKVGIEKFKLGHENY